jgi:hypothetical protein
VYGDDNTRAKVITKNLDNGDFTFHAGVSPVLFRGVFIHNEVIFVCLTTWYSVVFNRVVHPCIRHESFRLVTTRHHIMFGHVALPCVYGVPRNAMLSTLCWIRVGSIQTCRRPWPCHRLWAFR